LKILFIINAVLLATVMVSGRSTAYNQYRVKTTSNDTKAVISSIPGIANNKVEKKVKTDDESSNSIITKVREILNRVSNEIEELLKNCNSDGNNNVTPALPSENPDNGDETSTTTPSNNGTTSKDTPTSGIPPSEPKSKSKQARLCRTANGIKECLCGPKNTTYIAAKFRCVDDKVIERSNKPKDAGTEFVMTLANEILKEILENKQHLGNSHETYLELVNESDEPLKIQVAEVDNHDWDGDSRPDHNFQDKEIAPHSTIKERQEINAKSSTAMSTFKLSQNGEEIMSMRIDQWAAKAEKIYDQDKDVGNGWKVHMTAGIDGNTLQYKFQKS